MFSEKSSLVATPLPKVSEALESAYKLQEDWLNYGLDFVHLYIKDVDGDWLDTWGEDEDNTDSLIAFLESDDLVALRVRRRLVNKPISEIATDLEQCLSALNQDEQLCAVKNVLAGGVVALSGYRDYGYDYEDRELLGLATDLLDKLAEIWEKEAE